MVIVIASMVVTVAVFRRKWSDYRYCTYLPIYTTPHHHSIHTTASFALMLCTVSGALWWHTPQCCVHLLLCRSKHPLPNPVYKHENVGIGSGGMVLANMPKNVPKNPVYMAANEAVTSFSSIPEEDKEKEHKAGEVQPFEASQEMVQRDTTHGCR